MEHDLQRLGYFKQRDGEDKYSDFYVKLNPVPVNLISKYGNGMFLFRKDRISQLYKNKDNTPLTYEQVERIEVLSKIKVIEI
jgi:hypothetical protein